VAELLADATGAWRRDVATGEDGDAPRSLDPTASDAYRPPMTPTDA
jgi:hypothetical protein